MAEFLPLKGETYICKDEIYRVEFVSKGSDSIILTKLSDDSRWEVRYSVFEYAYKRVWRTGTVAQLLNRSPRSIYRLESQGKIQKAKRYRDAYGREIRYYTKQDLLDAHEMVSEIHTGRPRKDKKVVNNSLPTKADLLFTLRERFGQ